MAPPITPATNPVVHPLHRKGWSTPLTLVVCAGVAVALGIVIFLNLGPGGPAEASDALDEDDWYAVQTRDLQLTVVASGELNTATRVEVRSRTWGRPEIEWVVAEGTVVAPGDPLFKLNSEDVEKRHEEHSLSTSRSLADRISAERELAIQRSNAESNRRQAEVDLELARLDRDKWLKGEVPEKRRDLKLKAKKAHRELERAKRDLDLSRQLYNQKFISLNELEDAEIDLVEAEDAVATADLAVEIYENYTYKRDLQKFTSQYEQKKSELERTIERNNSKLERLQADLVSKKETHRLREERLRRLEEQITSTQVDAPSAGTVIYATSVGPWWRRRNPIAPGRTVRENETLILLPDMSRMTAEIKVHEARIQEIDLGMLTEVRIDARPDDIVQGRVVSVSSTAESSGGGNRALREYKVVVELPEGFDRSLKPGMSCQGTIRTGRVQDTLAVPIQAVFAEGEHRFVYIDAPGDPGRVVRRLVELGPSNATHAAVTAGLTAGQRVLLRAPRPGEALPPTPFPDRPAPDSADPPADPLPDPVSPAAAPATQPQT